MLSASDQVQIQQWVAAHGTPQQVVLRSRIVLAAASGQSDSAIARLLDTNRKTVILWRARFAAQGLKGLWEIAPGRGRKPTYGTKQITAIVEATLHTKPKGMTHWSCRLMAASQGVSKSTVNTIWRSHQLKPHQTKRFKLSRDPRFLEKLTDVVGLYLNPPQQAVVLCVDEKSQIQALDRTPPGLPLKKGRCGTMTPDDKRHGTTTLFAALGSLAGPGHRPVRQAASASEVCEIPASVGPGVSGGHAVTRSHGQLRDAHASQGASLAQATSPPPSALRANQFQLAQSDRALVRRTDI
jgi:transposase